MKIPCFIVLTFVAFLGIVHSKQVNANSSISSQYDSETVRKSIITKAQAISAVKSKLNGKVLSVNLIKSQGPPVYRVKVLLDKGRVRTVFVDASNGRVVRIR
jgi:uncharacterized membrane protein YkoI